MSSQNQMTLRTEGETHVVVTRHFDAPPEAVYRAHTDPELIRQWCLGPDGWTMPVCISEARPGGRIRYEWSDGKGGGFFLTGEFIELVPNRKIVHVERMLETGMEHGMEASYRLATSPWRLATNP